MTTLARVMQLPDPRALRLRHRVSVGGIAPALRGGAMSFVASIAFALALSAAPAAGQESVMIDGVRPELHLGLGWDAELGFGARVDIPIVPRGFLNGNPHDEFALSPGGELYFDGDDDELGVAALLAAQWNLYLDPEWSVFPELGLALIFRDRDRGRGDDDGDLFLRPLFAAGARYHWTRRNAIVMRLGYPFGLQVGITL